MSWPIPSLWETESKWGGTGWNVISGNIYLLLGMWKWLSRIFNRNAWWDLPPYRSTILVADWWCNVCLFTWWINTRFLLQRLTLETGGFELASTVTLVLQANWLTKCASHYNFNCLQKHLQNHQSFKTQRENDKKVIT